MGLISTLFISYPEINTENTDLISDAFGIEAGFRDVIEFLDWYKPVPDNELISSVIGHVKELN